MDSAAVNLCGRRCSQYAPHNAVAHSRLPFGGLEQYRKCAIFGIERNPHLLLTHRRDRSRKVIEPQLDLERPAEFSERPGGVLHILLVGRYEACCAVADLEECRRSKTRRRKWHELLDRVQQLCAIKDRPAPLLIRSVAW